MLSRRLVLIHAAAALCALASQTVFAPSSFAAEQAKKKVLLIAGKPSHGYAEHEHNAGCMLLAKCLNESGLPVEAVVQQERLADGLQSCSTAWRPSSCTATAAVGTW